MTSNKPYMVRAVHEWILANDCTPYLVVTADYPGVFVPEDFVRDGQITLNIAPSAVKDLQITDSNVAFNARFGGIPTEISAAMGAVVAIFAKENGQGMGFEIEEPPQTPQAVPTPEKSSPSDVKKPSLKVVK